MTLHLIKLCVGVDSIAELRAWQRLRVRQGAPPGCPRPPCHTTRMTPRRAAELLDGGSLYWVIQGLASVRQRLEDIRPFVDGEGVARCHLVLDRQLVPVAPVPRRPFQGWRYLAAADAPPDCPGCDGEASGASGALREELSRLGL